MQEYLLNLSDEEESLRVVHRRQADTHVCRLRSTPAWGCFVAELFEWFPPLGEQYQQQWECEVKLFFNGE